MIECVKSIHSTGFIHADIKVDNIMVNIKNQLFLIDYGCSQKINQPDGTHRPMITENKFKGNVKFASKNVMIGLTLSKRDDLI